MKIASQYQRTPIGKTSLRIPGIKKGKNVLRWLRAKVHGRALVLGYHRVSSSQGILDEVCVAPENFAEHLHELRKHTHPLRLSELVQRLKDGTLPDKSVAITFDDGYADNLYAAKPLLEKYEIPATVFICTGYMGKEFWWDELERLVTCSQVDVHTLHLQAEGKQFAWHQTTAGPNAEQRELRNRFCRALYHFLLSLNVEEQEQCLELIRNWSEVSSSQISTRRALSEGELLQLVEGGLIELGAHTEHHPMLPRLSPESQRKEIQAGKEGLEMLLNKKIMGFSYPNGKVTMDAKRLLSELDFAYGCTSLEDVIRPGSDLYELPRFWQQDVDGDQFVKRLNRWMRLGV